VLHAEPEGLSLFIEDDKRATTQAEELQAPLPKCNNVEGFMRREKPEKSTVGDMNEAEEVDLDLRAEFCDDRPTFDEPISAVRLGPSPH